MTSHTNSGERDALLQRFADRISPHPSFTRRKVSYQGNRDVPGFRWMRYKEGFSTELVRELLGGTTATVVLDPFAGIGTTPLVASRMGMQSIGIDIMPVGLLLASSLVAASNLDPQRVEMVGRDLIAHLGGIPQDSHRLQHAPITRGAFPSSTEDEIALSREFTESLPTPMKTLITVACMSVLEEISYTRKDGQFLRWDRRRGRNLKSQKLNKGPLPSMAEAVQRKLAQIVEDMPILPENRGMPVPRLIEGSSLTELWTLPSNSVDVTVTSPPYANRYDYTRTYALELVYLGWNEEDIKWMRQQLLSATVENRSKRDALLQNYGDYRVALDAFVLADYQPALGEVLGQLKSKESELSNRGVISLVENYFTEMSLVVAELARVTRPGGHVFMVNDNVRYHGEEVPVDLILSDFAEQWGLRCEEIWTLPRGKGNSSQQMGKFGRVELRKGVYHWVRS